MGRQIAGHLILIVENEALIALDMAHAFQRDGARVATSDSVPLALELVEADVWSAVVLGPTVSDGDSSRLCERLKQRDTPFVLYTGSSRGEGACREAPRVYMPAGPATLVRTVEALVQGQSISQ